MRKNNLLLIGGLAALAYFIFKGQNVSGAGAVGNTASTGSLTAKQRYPQLAVALQQSTARQSTSTAAYNSAVDKFLATETDTTASIHAGVDVINTAFQTGAQLHSTSTTIIKPTITPTGTTGGVAQLGTGAVVKISTTNIKGPSAMDKQIAANLAALKVSNPTQYAADTKNYASSWA